MSDIGIALTRGGTDLNPADPQCSLLREPGARRRRLVVAMAMAPLSALAAPEDPRTVVVVAASDLTRVWPVLMKQFERHHPDVSVRVSFGSSGTFLRQIREGLPFDLFLSADQSYIQDLVREGRVVPPGTPLVQGRLLLSHRLTQPAQTYSKPLEARSVRTIVQTSRAIAIANPAHAPYGKAAQQALVSWGLWDQALPKLVMAESASQAAQFLFQGAAQSAFIPRGLLENPTPNPAFGWSSQTGALAFENWVVPGQTHQPIVQGMGVARQAGQAPQVLTDFLRSRPALTVFQAFGFEPLGAN